MLKNYMQDQSDLGLRQYAAIQLGQLHTRSGDIDAETILQIVASTLKVQTESKDFVK